MRNTRRVTGITLFWLFALPICIVLRAAAQTPSITAKVVDEGNQPVPFASVRLIKFNSGVITNADGSFQIPARPEFLRDTLAITCIGFKTRRVAMAGLDPSKQNIIRLQSAAVELSAVEIQSTGVKRLTGAKLVERAIHRIPYNYPNQPFSYIAYYRDYQIKDKQYINLNEALLQVNDEGFTTDDQLVTKLQLFEYKQNPAFPIDTLARKPYDRSRKFIPQASLKNFKGNELATLMVHDPIRNHKVFSFSFVNKLDKDFLYNHRFSITGRIVEEGKELYIVSFTAHDRVSGPEHRATGKIYIEKVNYRIHKLQYSTDEFQEHQPVPLYNVNVEYSLHDDQMYLNYISFNNEFKLRNPDDFMVVDVRQVRDSSGFVVRFSHIPSDDAINPMYYDFRINGRRIEIGNILFTEDRAGRPGYHLSVLVMPKDKTMFNEALYRSEKKAMTFDVQGIKDVAGREVNVPTYLSATQYREIFVQQLLAERSAAEKYLVIDKYRPLYEMPTSVLPQTPSSLWMNTPLKKEIEKVSYDQ